jgi:uncharacterized delta-60 repeat protein/uncharacterized repeat protein (TIGR01451 family)
MSVLRNAHAPDASNHDDVRLRGSVQPLARARWQQIVNRQWPVALALLALALALALVVVQAAGGGLDATFGTGGRVVTNFGDADVANAVAIDAQGRIVAAGYTTVNGTFDLAIARYAANGSLDLTFGTGGKVITNFGAGTQDSASGVAVDALGRIVVVGEVTQEGVCTDPPCATRTAFLMARYDTNGVLDPSFQGGIFRLDFDSDESRAKAVVIDSLQRIVIAGFSNQGGVYKFAILRLNSDGTTDQAFGGGAGVVFTGIGSQNAAAFAVALDGQERIVAAGDTFDGATISRAVARYDSAGNSDGTFNSSGRLVTPGLGAAYAVTVDALGRIVTSGAADGEFTDVALARLNDDGTLDNTFGSGGRVLASLGGPIGTSLAIDGIGRLIAGFGLPIASGVTQGFALARYLPSGALDETFSGGVVTTDFSNPESLNALAIDAAGRIVAAGAASSNFAVARYLDRPLADLSISKTSPSTVVAGDTVSFNLFAGNLGPDPATSVVVVDDLPSSLTFASCASSPGTCGGSGNHRTVTFSSLASGSFDGFNLFATVNFDVPDGTVITNTATISAASPDDPAPGNNTASASMTVHNKSDVFVTESVAKLANRQLSYTVAVKNLGPYEARRLVLNDAMPNGTNFVSVTGGWNCQPLPVGSVGTLSCTLDALASGSAAPLGLIVKTVAPGSVNISNIVAVAAATFDPNTANNSATLVTRVAGK